MMHGAEKSGLVIVAGKPADKAEQPAPEGSAAMLNAAEPVERRAGTKGNADQQSTCRTQSRVSVSQALERIRQRSAVTTRGGSRMRESRTYGSVRGARGNSRPYRESRRGPVEPTRMTLNGHQLAGPLALATCELMCLHVTVAREDRG